MAFESLMDAGGEVFAQLVWTNPIEEAIDTEAQETVLAATAGLEYGADPAKAVEEAYELLELMRECGVGDQICNDLANSIQNLEGAIDGDDQREIVMYLDQLRFIAREIDRINVT